MITRGIIIGKLIDDLSILQGQINLRCQVGLTDLNKFCEDFFKDILNICYNINLKNVNEERSNEPGIDLADSKNKIAFQVTSTSTSEKVNNTLEKITTKQLEKYPEIKILILGKKQQKYDAVDPDLIKKCTFDISNIIDISDLCKQMITLKYDNLHELFTLFEKQFQIVITEFEIPNKEGVYPTNLYEKLEIVPNTFCLNAKKFLSQYEETLFENIEPFFKKLGKLPRVTREFLHIIIELGEDDFGNFRVDYNELKRKLRITPNELKEEISILHKRGFVFEPDEFEPEVRTRFVESEIEIIDFGIKNDCLKKLLIAMDFTVLDE